MQKHILIDCNSLVIEQDGPIGYLRIDRPNKHNALSKQMWLDIPRAINALEKACCQIIAITGNNRTFSAGADFNDLKAIETQNDAREFWQAIKNCLDFVESHPLPTVAIVDGPCLGGGLLLALACDLRLASFKSSFALPVAKLGIFLDHNSVRRLVELVGKGRALDLLYSGDTISGEQALQIGLLNRLWANDDLQKECQKYLLALSRNSLESMKHSKQLLRANQSELKNSQEEDKIIEAYLSKDFKKRLENITSFSHAEEETIS